MPCQFFFDAYAARLTLGVFGGFPKLGYHFGGPHNKDFSTLGSMLGSPTVQWVRPYIYTLDCRVIGVV